MKFCCDLSRHVVCIPYSVENLHRMAEALNIKRGWYHSGTKPHYDIPKGRLAEVIACCELVSPRRVLEIIVKQVQE